MLSKLCGDEGVGRGRKTRVTSLSKSLMRLCSIEDSPTESCASTIKYKDMKRVRVSTLSCGTRVPRGGQTQEARGCEPSIFAIADEEKVRVALLLDNDIQCRKLVGGESVETKVAPALSSPRLDSTRVSPRKSELVEMYGSALTSRRKGEVTSSIETSRASSIENEAVMTP
jgi:hypothetical protein